VVEGNRLEIDNTINHEPSEVIPTNVYKGFVNLMSASIITNLPENTKQYQIAVSDLTVSDGILLP
jgi:hypothetical protein